MLLVLLFHWGRQGSAPLSEDLLRIVIGDDSADSCPNVIRTKLEVEFRADSSTSENQQSLRGCSHDAETR